MTGLIKEKSGEPRPTNGNTLYGHGIINSDTRRAQESASQTPRLAIHDGSQDPDTFAEGNVPDGSSPPINNPLRSASQTTSENEKKKFIARRVKERKIKQLISFEELFRSEPKYPQYYVVNFPGIDIDSDLNVIAADECIKKDIGNTKKITKLNRNALLVQTANEHQGQKLLEIKKIDKNPVTVQLHRTMNHVKGTVYSEAMSRSSEEEILDKLKDQHVTKIERMKRKVDGDLVDTHRYILTFSLTKLPSLVKLAEWHREIVSIYIPKPMRCINCQRLGHTKKWCRRTKQTCARCGEEGHKAFDCKKKREDTKCINCTGKHLATDPKCEQYQMQCEILATQAREHITHYEARDRVRERYVEEGKTYRWAARANLNNVENNTTETNRITETNSTNQLVTPELEDTSTSASNQMITEDTLTSVFDENMTTTSNVNQEQKIDTPHNEEPIKVLSKKAASETKTTTSKVNQEHKTAAPRKEDAIKTLHKKDAIIQPKPVVDAASKEINYDLKGTKPKQPIEPKKLTQQTKTVDPNKGKNNVQKPSGSVSLPKENTKNNNAATAEPTTRAVENKPPQAKNKDVPPASGGKDTKQQSNTISAIEAEKAEKRKRDKTEVAETNISKKTNSEKQNPQTFESIKVIDGSQQSTFFPPNRGRGGGGGWHHQNNN